MDYQEKILELAKKEGLKVYKGMLLENVYNELFFKLAKDNNDLKAENDCFRQGIESKNNRIDELKGDILALNNDITKIANKKYDLELEMLNIKNEEKSKIESLEEIIDNYRKGIENSNVQLSEFKGKEEKLKSEIANLKQLLKAVTYLL